MSAAGAVGRLALDVATGLAAGWAGTQVKGLAEDRLQTWGEQVLPPEPGQKQLPGADHTDADNMPPTKLYLALPHAAARLLGADSTEAGAGRLHTLMGYGSAVAYSVLSRPLPQLRAAGGLLGGALLFAGTHGSSLPAAGFQAAPWRLPRAWWLWEGGSHLAYGATVDGVLRVTRAVTG